MLQAAPSIIQLVAIYFVPESPRWLIANDRAAEAEAILAKWHAGSDVPDEIVRVELQEIHAAIQKERNQQTAGYSHFFKTRKS